MLASGWNWLAGAGGHLNANDSYFQEVSISQVSDIIPDGGGETIREAWREWCQTPVLGGCTPVSDTIPDKGRERNRLPWRE
jgi:hypothetical protein